MNKYCACGCDLKVKNNNKFLKGHYINILNRNCKRLGKTYEQIYGIEKAKDIKNKIANALKNKTIKPEQYENYENFCKNIGKAIKKRYINESHEHKLKRLKNWIEAGQKASFKTLPQRIAKMKSNTYPERIFNNLLIELDQKVEEGYGKWIKKYNNVWYHQIDFFNKHRFVVDFLNPQKKIVVEIFGDYWHGRIVRSILKDFQIRNMQNDIKKRKYIEKCGWKFIIIWESELKNSYKEIKNKIGEIINEKEYLHSK